jgi:outer membrane protein OmpA-like peptidoglycan-associated protein
VRLHAERRTQPHPATPPTSFPLSLQLLKCPFRNTRGLRRGAWWGSLAALAAVSLLWSAPAAAQAESHDDYALAPLQDGSMLSVWGSRPLEPGRYALGLGMQVRPRLLSDESSTAGVQPGGAVSTVELLGTVGVWHRLDFSAGITAHSGSLEDAQPSDADADADADQAALGDVRLIPRVRLLGGDSGTGRPSAAPVCNPAGTASVYRSQGLRLEPRALASHVVSPVTLSANAGYLFNRPEQDLEQVTKDAITAAMGADIALLDAWSVVTEISSRWYVHGFSADADTRLPVEARAGVRFASDSWVVQLGGGLGLRGGAVQPDWRLLAAVGFRVPDFQRQAPRARSDRDDDGVPDKSDACPDEAEARRGASDMEGCPLDPNQHVELAAEPPNEPAAEATSAEYPVDVAIEGSPLLQIDEVLYFELNKMRLEPDQLLVLDVVAGQVRAAPADTQLVIEGHSDSIGPAAFNTSLSRMRASTVRLYLIQRGIPWRRLQIAGHGSSQPVELDIDDAGRSRNRRVEFRLTRNTVE